MSEVLQVNNISISFGGIRAVQNVTFSVHKGEVLGLIGPNGAGKSTCVNLISGVNRLDQGEIIFDGKVLTLKDTVPDRAKMGMGRTFQTPKPFGNYSVYDNIFCVALTRYSFKEAARKTQDILKITRLEHYSEYCSLKLPIEKRKWLDLARVLALEPKFIMMDEVMAGLNPHEMEESLALVRNINKEGVSVLFIEHVMKAVVNVCSRIIVLNEGQFLCEGEPKEVLERKEVIMAYLGGQKC